MSDPKVQAALEQAANLREWVAGIIDEFVEPLGVQANEHAIDQLTQVIECRAREIAREALVRSQATTDIVDFLAETDGMVDVWWHKDDQGRPVASVNCNDLFWWGCADSERITPENLATLRQAYLDADAVCAASYATMLFAARVRGMRPQGAAYPKECPNLWPLLDACGPEREVGMGNPKASPAAEREGAEGSR